MEKTQQPTTDVVREALASLAERKRREVMRMQAEGIASDPRARADGRVAVRRIPLVIDDAESLLLLEQIRSAGPAPTITPGRRPG